MISAKGFRVTEHPAPLMSSSCGKMLSGVYERADRKTLFTSPFILARTYLYLACARVNPDVR